MALFKPGKPSIEEGDMVIVYERFDSMKAMTVTANGCYQNRFGVFQMKEWIGRPFGCRMVSRSGDGWVYLLAPTAELWTLVLRHRTQILYIADIATVCTQLDLRPGAVVLESGTGSGSLTTSLARAVAPTGHVHTFEFHELRAKTAADEFKANGLSDIVTVQQRNIEEEGFPAELEGQADTVFLDLPGPWKAVPSAAASLRPDGVFCGFSPCMEQVQKTAEALNANGFRDIRTIEILLREYDIGAEPPAGGEEALAAALAAQAAGDGGGGRGGGKRARVAQRQKGKGGNVEEEKEEAEGAAAAAAAAADAGEEGKEAAGGEGGEAAAAEKKPKQQQQQQQQQQVQGRISWARPISQGRGHSGYLTFARKAVQWEG